MLTYRDSFSQMAVSEAARKFPFVREWIGLFAASNYWPTVCLTPEDEKAGVNPTDLEYAAIVYPEESYLVKTELFVCRNDVNKENGIPREIGFVNYHRKCDKYGSPIEGWKVGGAIGRNGILCNHGTESEPSWSLHT